MNTIMKNCLPVREVQISSPARLSACGQAQVGKRRFEYRAAFEPFKKLITQCSKDQKKPRYTVRVAFGKRGEPWVMRVETR